MTPEQITQIYSFFFNIPILARLILFNFIFKAHKRILAMLMDVIVFISTAIWLVLIKDVILPPPSLILKLAGILYIIIIIDFSYNFYRFKKRLG